MKILVLDESGSINNSRAEERYFVLGGIIYDFSNFEIIKEKLIPRMELYRKLKDCDEIKSNSLSGSSNLNNLIYGSIISDINNCKEVTPIIYILDKQSSYVFDYFEHVSYKYNKLIKFLIEDLEEVKLIDSDDEIRILMDQYTFDEYNMRNFKSWLPNNVSSVKSVDMGESKKYNFIQIADIIAGIPKLKGVSPKKVTKDHKLKLLDRCFIHVFPRHKVKELVTDE